MMKHLLIAGLLGLSAVNLFAQDCSCTKNFEFASQKLEVNYSGFQDKVNNQTRAAFEEHTLQFRERAALTTSDTACYNLVFRWTKFFNDQHVQMTYDTPQESPEDVRKRYANAENIPVTETEVRAYLDAADRGALEGIYEMEGGNYRVALLPRKRQGRVFTGIILRADSVYWMPGQIKFELTQSGYGTYDTRFYMRDHSERTAKTTLVGHFLQMDGLSTWQKVYPGTGELATPAPKTTFILNQVDSQTVLLVVPTMNDKVRRELDSLMKAEKKLLESTPNWIIDCRNNGGGSDITFSPLLPYIYTNPVKLHNMQLWATADNADKFEVLSKDMDFPKHYRRQFAKQARKMNRHRGEWVGKEGVGTLKRKEVTPMPRHVAILINRNCASSCEQFVLYAEQSSKVVLVGENTGGVLDYGNLHNLTFPCYNGQLWYPTSRSNRVPDGKAIDNVGIAPAVKIPEGTTDWVGFAKGVLEGKSGLKD